MDYEFPKQLAQAMAGMTQMEVKAASGVDQSVISRLLRGKMKPTESTILKLERALPKLRELRSSEAA